MTATTRFLKCACCGGDAGCWEQWHNQDTGWGLCAPCSAWIAGRGMRPEEMNSVYGMVGVHREAPTHALYGWKFAVLATFSNTDAGTDRANAFMTANPGASVLEVTKSEIILAMNDDMGRKPAAPTSQA